MGPLLFSVHINDLSKYLPDCKVNLYADDTALYVHNTCYIDLMLSLRIELSTVDQWLKANRLTLNVKKTKFTILGSKNKLKQIPDALLKLSINHEEIDRVHVMKYLGMMIDENLDFTSHIDYIYRKSCHKLGAIRKARTFVGRKIALHLYKSLVIPLVDYCDIVYHTATKESLNK